MIHNIYKIHISHYVGKRTSMGKMIWPEFQNKSITMLGESTYIKKNSVKATGRWGENTIILSDKAKIKTNRYNVYTPWVVQRPKKLTRAQLLQELLATEQLKDNNK